MSAETADHEAELEKVCEKLEAKTGLTVCPYDQRSPDYWTTNDTDPCKFCGQLNDPDAPDVCKGVDLSVMDEAARLLREMAAENERLRGVLDAIASFSDTPGKVFAERFPDLAAKVREHPAPFSSQTLCQFARQALTKGKPHD